MQVQPFLEVKPYAAVSTVHDYIPSPIDLHQQLIARPVTTTICRVKGYGLEQAGLWRETLAVIDSSIPLFHRKYAVAFDGGEYTLKKVQTDETGHYLMPLDDSYLPMKVSDGDDFLVYGTVTYTINCYEPLSEYHLFEEEVDLNAALIEYPKSTYLARLFGVSLEHLGICSGALALVNKAAKYEHNDLVVVWKDGFRLMQLHLDKKDSVLKSLITNEMIKISDCDGLTFWGRVTHVINTHLV